MNIAFRTSSSWLCSRIQFCNVDALFRWVPRFDSTYCPTKSPSSSPPETYLTALLSSESSYTPTIKCNHENDTSLLSTSQCWKAALRTLAFCWIAFACDNRSFLRVALPCLPSLKYTDPPFCCEQRPLFMGLSKGLSLGVSSAPTLWHLICRTSRLRLLFPAKNFLNRGE